MIDADRATFEIQTLSGWEPLLVALSRDRLLGKQFWRKGEPEVEFRVDVAGIRASLGALEIRAVDAANGASLGATVRIEGHALAAGGYQYPSLRIDPDEGLRLVNVPPGGYTAIASAAGYEALARAEVAPGRTTRTTVRFAQPAHVVLRFLPEEGWLPPRASRVEYRDTEGRALSCTWREEPGTNGTLIRVGGAPPGPGVLLCAGNALEVQLEPGSNGERDFPVRPPRLLRVKWKETAEERFAHDGEGRLLYEGRTRVAEKSWPADFTFDPEWDHVDFSAAPGRYAVEVELASGRRARGEVIVGVGEITEVVIEPR